MSKDKSPAAQYVAMLETRKRAERARLTAQLQSMHPQAVAVARALIALHT